MVYFGRKSRLVVAVIPALLVLSCAADVGDPASAVAAQGADKVDAGLAALYADFESFVASGGRPDAFQASHTGLRVSQGRVDIEATAAGPGAALAEQLESLGATSIAQRAGMVSCRIPIASIPRLSTLSALRYARPVYQVTH